MNILEKFIGLVFLSAGIHRIFLKNQRENEAYNMIKLPKYSDYLIIIFEIVIGIIILFDLPGKYYSLIFVTIMASIGTLLLVINNWDNIIKTYTDLFTLQTNSLSVCVHLTYIVILIFLIKNYKSNKN